MSLPDDPVSAKNHRPGEENAPCSPPAGELSQVRQTGGESLEWERWNLKEDPRRLVRLLLLVVVLLLAGAVLVVSLPITAAVALGLALVVTLLPYLLPRRFALGEKGLSIQQGFYTTRREWSEIESYQKIGQGYLLHTRPKEGTKPPWPNPLSPGSKELFLPFPLESEKLSRLENLLSLHIPFSR